MLSLFRSEMILARDQYEVCSNKTKIIKTLYSTTTAQQVIYLTNLAKAESPLPPPKNLFVTFSHIKAVKKN